MKLALYADLSTRLLTDLTLKNYFAGNPWLSALESGRGASINLYVLQNLLFNIRNPSWADLMGLFKTPPIQR